MVYSNNHLREWFFGVKNGYKNKNKELCGRNRMPKNKYSAKIKILFYIIGQKQVHTERCFKKHMNFRY